MLFPWLLFFTEFVTLRVQEPFVLYRSYLWMAGAPAVLPFLASRLSARQVVAGCVVLALILGVAMRQRLETFSSELALWDDVVNKNTDLSLPFVDRGYDNRAVGLLRADRHDEALRDLEMALKLNPRSSHAYVNRATVHARMGLRAKALADFDRAIELDPAFANAYSERCALLLAMKEAERALESCNAALRIAPTIPSALINRAILLVRERRLKEALADLDTVIRYEPASGIALYYRGRVYHELGRVREFEQDVRASCKVGFGPACAALSHAGVR